MNGTDNRAAVFDLIRSEGTVSRVALAHGSGLTEASVSRIVKTLLEEGVVIEKGQGVSTGGKRPTLLELNAAGKHAVGVYLSDYEVRIVLTNLSGVVLASRTRGFGKVTVSRDEFVSSAAHDIAHLLAERKVDRTSVLGVGVAIPGHFSSTPRDATDETEWAWSVIEHDLATATGFLVLLENDATCAAMGEYWASRAPSAQDLGVVTIASGIGFGLVTNGDVHRGASSNAGELGHVSVDMAGPSCYCGSRGCVELYAAPRSMVAAGRRDADLAKLLGAESSSDTSASYSSLARAAVDGNESARAIIASAAKALGAAIVSVANVLDLDQVVLTGPALDVAGPLIVDEVGRIVSQTVFAREAHPVHIRLSASRDDPAAVGAATLVIHHLLDRAVPSAAGRSKALPSRTALAHVRPPIAKIGI